MPRVPLLVLFFLLCVRVAYANDAATADALFREGREAMKRGDHELAAKRFAESDRLQPAPGTKLNLAAAESKTTHLASAWEHARAARDDLAKNDERYSLATSLFEELDRRVPRLTIRAMQPLSSDARVRIDGSELREGVLDVALPQDPGKHQVVVSSPTTEDAAFEITLTEGAKQVLEVHEGKKRAVPVSVENGSVGPVVPQRGPGGGRPGDTQTPVSGSGSTQSTIGYVLVAAAGASLLFGGASMIVRESITQSYNANPKCDTPESSPECQSQKASRDTWLGLAIGAFAGAGVLAGVGITLLVTAPSPTGARTAMRCNVLGPYASCTF
jgi:hypothetical protein